MEKCQKQFFKWLYTIFSKRGKAFIYCILYLIFANPVDKTNEHVEIKSRGLKEGRKEERQSRKIRSEGEKRREEGKVGIDEEENRE